MINFSTMNWMLYAVIAAVALAGADVLIKIASGRVSTALGLALYGSVPFMTGLIWHLVDRSRGLAKPASLGAMSIAASVGLAFMVVTIAMYAAFRGGAPLSIASPVIRLGGLVVASALGIMLWKEPVTARYLAGVGLACAGIYLIVTK